MCNSTIYNVIDPVVIEYLLKDIPFTLYDVFKVFRYTINNIKYKDCKSIIKDRIEYLIEQNNQMFIRSYNDNGNYYIYHNKELGFELVDDQCEFSHNHLVIGSHRVWYIRPGIPFIKVNINKDGRISIPKKFLKIFDFNAFDIINIDLEYTTIDCLVLTKSNDINIDHFKDIDKNGKLRFLVSKYITCTKSVIKVCGFEDRIYILGV